MRRWILWAWGDPPEHLRSRAEARWATATEAQRADEEESLFAYLEAHDLAAGLAGVFPASVFFTREGSLVRLAARDSVVRVQLEDAEKTLVQLGDAIARRLADVAEDERAASAIELWRSREEPKVLPAVSTATGLSASDANKLFRDVALQPKLGGV